MGRGSPGGVCRIHGDPGAKEGLRRSSQILFLSVLHSNNKGRYSPNGEGGLFPGSGSPGNRLWRVLSCLRTSRECAGEDGRSVMKVQEEILGCFDAWNRALQSGDPGEVAKLYAADAILLPTVSNAVRHNFAEIRDYFAHFMESHPSGRIDEPNVRVYGDLAINSGVYTFSFPDKPPIQGRFTFVYRKNGQRWEIVEHHSSRMPE